MKIKNFNKKLLIIPVILLLLIVIPITVFLVQQQTKTKSSAAAATTLSLEPATKTVVKDDTFSLDVKVNPTNSQGVTNLVTQVTLLITYDPTKLEVTDTGFVPNQAAFPTTNHGPVYGSGTISVTVSNVSCQSCIVQRLASVGTINFKAIAPTDQNVSTEVKFVTTGTNKTEVKASSASDTSSINEDVLASTIPANIKITGTAVCPVDNATCSWDPVNGASSYHYKVTEDESDTVVTEDDTTDTTIPFDSEAGKTYTCTVTPSNTCGPGSSGQATATCKATPAPKSCNGSCTSNDQCQTGLVCTGTAASPGFCRKQACLDKTDCICSTALKVCNTTCTDDSECSSGFCYLANASDTSGFCRNSDCETQTSCACPGPAATPTPTPLPTATPTPTVLAGSTCPYTCESSNTCNSDNGLQQVSGYTCVDEGTVCCKELIPTATPTPIEGQSIVNIPTSTPAPTLLPTGPGSSMVQIGAVGLILSVIGALILLVF